MSPAHDGEEWKSRLKALGLSRRRTRRAAPAGPRPVSPEPARPLAPHAASGRGGEGIAADHLAARGVVILARNVRYANGELDLVGEAGGVLLFVEVKRRKDAERGSPAETVTPRKRARILRAARRWLAENPTRLREFRFDVVAIQDEPSRVDWIQGAFDAS